MCLVRLRSQPAPRVRLRAQRVLDQTLLEFGVWEEVNVSVEIFTIMVDCRGHQLMNQRTRAMLLALLLGDHVTSSSFLPKRGKKVSNFLVGLGFWIG